MLKKITWNIAIASALLIGLYPIIYFIIDRKFGLLSTKTDTVLNNLFWNIAFYTHITLGGVALLIGWILFNEKRRSNNIQQHKCVGKVYVIAALLCAITGIYIGYYATGGNIASAGFMCLGVIWFGTTVLAFINIKNKQIKAHQRLMVYSYALCFAAVTLRIWLPLLSIITQNFILAYTLTAWLCWLPNVVVAYIINQKQ